MECHIHKIPMTWMPEVLYWLDKYGCLRDPCEEISMMALTTQDRGVAAH